MTIYFISFGSTHNYSNSLNRIKKQAEDSGFFDKIIIYTEKDFDKEYYEKYGELMKNSRGYGYWIWKSYFVKKTFESMRNDDILVYADAGCTIVSNDLSHKKFNIFINLLKSHQSGSIGFQLDFAEELYTKSNIFEKLDAEEHKKSKQVMATIFFLRKCVNSVNLVEDFYKYSHQIELINNDFDRTKEITTFVAPRNDQSIFSILRKKYSSLIIPDSTYHSNFNTPEAWTNPILSTRIRK